MNKRRTLTQNKALHKYFELLARAMDEQGITITEFVKALDRFGIELFPTKETVKENVWKVVQERQTGKKSTTELTTDEVKKVYEPINKFFSENWGIHVPFPSYEEQSTQSLLQNN